MVKNIPDEVKPVLEQNHLNLLLGLKVDANRKPKLGKMWNQVVKWPTQFPSSKRPASQQSSQPQNAAAASGSAGKMQSHR